MTRHSRSRFYASLALPVVLFAAPLLAEDEDTFDRTPTDCLPVSLIRRTEVVDDQTIIFHMRGRKAYRNYLPRKCPGLARENRFGYDVRGSRLCSIDTVTVLEQYAGRLERGFTCQLGEFHPLSPDEIDDLAVKKKRGIRDDAIEAQPAEVPPREEAEGEREAP
jgi:hypothetical protein